MSHYFREPNSFRFVNCKRVAGERARKKCREWNAFIRRRNKLRAEGRIAEAIELERPYLGEPWEVEEPERFVLESELDTEELNDPYNPYVNDPYLVMLNALCDDVESDNVVTRRSLPQKSAKKKNEKT